MFLTLPPGSSARLCQGSRFDPLLSYDKAQKLGDFPQLGHKYREEAEGDIHILLYGHYRIAYIISGNYIDILF
jgi:plasmid stabilization system protein ParE